MNRITKLFVSFTLCVGLMNCNSHSHDGHAHAADGSHIDAHGDEHGHAHDIPSMNLNAISNQSELFIDLPVMFVGKDVILTTHLTNLSKYKPYQNGTCRVALMQNGEKVQETLVGQMPSPGVFVPQLSPTISGIFDLVVEFENDVVSETFAFENIMVYASEDDAIHNFPHAIDNDDVLFTKEQAWKIEFGIEQVLQQDIQNIIRTSGEVLPLESDEKSVTAANAGVVIFNANNLVEGQNIKKGTSLFSINNDKLISSNLTEKYTVLKANVESSKKNLERSRDLLAKNIISQKEFDNRERQYAVDLASYETLNRNFSADGMTLSAPTSGILKKLYVREGEYVKEGQSLALISRNKQLLVEAEVSQKYFKDVGAIQSANIKLPWNEEVVSIKDYNGKLVSTASTGKEHYIPVVFKIDNKGDIMPGTFLEIYLQTSQSSSAIVIPKTALLKEYDLYYVYVMRSGEKYEKRNVILGIDDGKKVQVLEGLNKNEVIVTKGAYAIKMASMSSSIPSHGHAH